MKRRILHIVIAATFPVLAAAQQTQTLRDRDPDLRGAKKLAAELEEANFHSGAFYLLSRFRIADAGYTEGTYIPAGEGSGRLSLRLDAPHRLYFVPRKKTVFTLEATPGLNLATRNDDHRRLDYLVRADAHFLFNHLYLNAYTLRSDQLRAVLAANEYARTQDSETGLAGEFKYSSRTSLQFAARLRGQRFAETVTIDRQEVELSPLDRDERNARVAFQHKTFPMTSLFVAAEASDYSFVEDEARDGSRRYAGGGFLFDSGRTQFRVEAGPARLDFEDPAETDFAGVIGSARANRRNGRWGYNAGVSRDLGFAIYADNNYYVADNATAGVTYAATRRLDLRAGVVGERHSYDVPFFGVTRRDTMSFTSVGFAYSFRRLRFGADGGWYRRVSTAPDENDSGIRYVLNLSFIP